MERDKFDNKTVSFEEHIKSEHSMWHYLYFLVLVRVKDPTEYTGPESYVAQMIAVSRPNEQTAHTVLLQSVFCILKAFLSTYIILQLKLQSYSNIIVSEKMAHKDKNPPKPRYFIIPAAYGQTSTSILSLNSYFAGEPYQSAHSYLSVGVLKLYSLPQFADLHSVLDKHEPLQQMSD